MKALSKVKALSKSRDFCICTLIHRQECSSVAPDPVKNSISLGMWAPLIVLRGYLGKNKRTGCWEERTVDGTVLGRLGGRSG